MFLLPNGSLPSWCYTELLPPSLFPLPPLQFIAVLSSLYLFASLIPSLPSSSQISTLIFPLSLLLCAFVVVLFLSLCLIIFIFLSWSICNSALAFFLCPCLLGYPCYPFFLHSPFTFHLFLTSSSIPSLPLFFCNNLAKSLVLLIVIIIIGSSNRSSATASLHLTESIKIYKI